MSTSMTEGVITMIIQAMTIIKAKIPGSIKDKTTIMIVLDVYVRPIWGDAPQVQFVNGLERRLRHLYKRRKMLNMWTRVRLRMRDWRMLWDSLDSYCFPNTYPSFIWTPWERRSLREPVKLSLYILRRHKILHSGWWIFLVRSRTRMHICFRVKLPKTNELTRSSLISIY